MTDSDEKNIEELLHRVAKQQGEIEDLEMLLESINRHVLPGTIDSVDGAIIELKSLRAENKELKAKNEELEDILAYEGI